MQIKYKHNQTKRRGTARTISEQATLTLLLRIPDRSINYKTFSRSSRIKCKSLLSLGVTINIQTSVTSKLDKNNTIHKIVLISTGISKRCHFAHVHFGQLNVLWTVEFTPLSSTLTSTGGSEQPTNHIPKGNPLLGRETAITTGFFF